MNPTVELVSNHKKANMRKSEFLMLKALFFTLPLKLPSKHWRFNQIDGTIRCSVKSCIRLIGGMTSLGALFFEHNALRRQAPS
jgi:hypothetical protein